MSPRKAFITVMVLVTLVSAKVVGDPLPSGHVKITSGESELITPDGRHFLLPVGTHILDGTTFQKLDDETIRLQNMETRYKAENKSLRDSIQSEPKMGWTAAFLLVGFMTFTGGIAYMISTH